MITFTVLSVESGQIVCVTTFDTKNAQPSTYLDGVRTKPELATGLRRVDSK